MSFIVFSDDWGGHPSSCQHIFKILSREHATIWVNTLGLRPPRWEWADARKALRKVARMIAPGRKRRVAEMAAIAPHVIAPPMTPLRRPAWLWELGNRSVLRGVRRAMAATGCTDPCVVTTVPNVCDVVGRLGAARVVYYCVDDFSEWPGMDRESVLAMERRLLRSVDRVVCTSTALLERFSKHFPCSLLTHGVDVELFTRVTSEEHAVLRGIPEPRVGYYGLLDARSDAELLTALADRLPGVSFVFTGPVESCPSSLRERPNVHLTGPVPYHELPAVVAGWKACLLPYRLNELTRKINPLKLKEYLATGKPVIATPLPEAQQLEPHVRIADGLEPWAEAVSRAVRGDLAVDARALQALLATCSWSAKAAELLALCQEARSPVGAA